MNVLVEAQKKIFVIRVFECNTIKLISPENLNISLDLLFLQRRKTTQVHLLKICDKVFVLWCLNAIQ